MCDSPKENERDPGERDRGADSDRGNGKNKIVGFYESPERSNRGRERFGKCASIWQDGDDETCDPKRNVEE